MIQPAVYAAAHHYMDIERERGHHQPCQTSYSDIMSSVGIVIDAINKFPQIKISCPDLLMKQRSITTGFEPGILNSARAVDGILIWMLKLCLKQVKKSGIDHKKFLCGKKHKLSLICQAVSYCHGYT